MEIITNHQPRPIIHYFELTDRERADFSWTNEAHEFFRYKGNTYCLSEFLPNCNGMWSTYQEDFKGWDAYTADSISSAILVRYPRDEYGNMDTDSVIVGLYLC